MKMQWLRFEQRIRDAFGNLHKDCGGDWDALSQDAMSATLLLLAEIVGEETGRGFPLDWVK